MGNNSQPITPEIIRRRFGIDHKALARARMIVNYDSDRIRGQIEIVFSAVTKIFGQHLNGKKILELGCVDSERGNRATLLEHFARYGATAYGVDLRRAHIPVELKGEMKFQQGKIQELNKIFQGQKFDAVVSSNLLQEDALSDAALNYVGAGERPNRDLLEETLRTKPVLLEDIKRKLKPHGYFILQTGHGDPWFKWKELEQAGFKVLAFERTHPTYYDIILIARLE